MSMGGRMTMDVYVPVQHKAEAGELIIPFPAASSFIYLPLTACSCVYLYICCARTPY